MALTPGGGAPVRRAVGLTLFACVALSGCADRQECRNHLETVGWAVERYREGHEGEFPPSLEAIDNGVLIPVLRCPGVRGYWGRGRHRGEGESDYVYLNWSDLSRGTNAVPDGYPMVYDQAFSNHGKGVNVLLTDGTVFWDKKAEWLAGFAKRHPGIQLPR